MKAKLLEVSENLFYYTEKHFNYGLDDEKERQFGIMFEVLDTRDFDEHADENYPFIVSAGIITDKPHESFNECEGEASKASLLYDCNSYMGTIPVDHILTHAVKGGNEQGEAWEALTKLFSCDKAKVVTTKAKFGTVAAQRGPEHEHKYFMFKDQETCMEFIEYLIEHRTGTMGMMIGFILDMPINLVGDSGWRNIETMTYGKDYNRG